MILTLDVGNSNIHTILYTQDKEVVLEQRTNTLREADIEFYRNYFLDLKAQCDCVVNKVMISCVVPRILETLIMSAKEVFNCEVIAINGNNVDLEVHLENPLELGADFIAGAYGAFNQYDMPVIIIDMGTASKISVVGENHTFLGGVIQPGVGQMANILSQNIDHLPHIELVVPDRYIGSNTIESIQAGIMHGSLLGLIELAKKMEEELGVQAKHVLTGGYIHLYKDTYGIEFNPNLINEGLYYLSKENFNENK